MKRLTIDVARQLAHKNKGRCLSTTYKNSKTKLAWLCSEGHRWEATLGSVRLLSSWCPKCSSKALHDALRSKRSKIANSELHTMAAERGGSWIAGEFKGQEHKLSWKCAVGHVWEASPSMIRAGRWCPTCSSGRGERLVRLAFEHIFMAPFPRTKPDWLKNSRGRKMELDGYNQKLGIAFEHQGEQHYEKNFFNLNNGGLYRRKSDDARKRRLCAENGVKLLLVPEVGSRIEVQKLATLILSWAKKNLPKQPINGSAINYVEAYTDKKGADELKALKMIAEQKGGRCLEPTFKGSKEPHKFECKEGHTWSANPYEVRKGAWCFKCYHKLRGINQRIKLEKLDALAESKGGKLITRDKLGSKIKLEWQCSNGHRWMAIANSIQQGRWCPICRVWTLSDLKEIAQSRGGELLTRTFVNAAQYFEWKCKAGHTWRAVGHRIAAGAWCPTCAGVIRPTIDDMQILASGRNGTCLSTKYNGAVSKLRWKCEKNHEWLATPSSIKQGSWCPKCFRERLSSIKRIGPLQVLEKLADANGGSVLSKENLGSRVKHEWQCSKGHRWKSKPTTIQQGHWCPKCSLKSRREGTN